MSTRRRIRGGRFAAPQQHAPRAVAQARNRANAGYRGIWKTIQRRIKDDPERV
jgi:hypothetical protein